MAIFCTPREESRLPQRPPARIVIGGALCTNTAGRFWVTLLHEIHWSFPGYGGLELRAACSGPLSAAVLDPAASLAREMERLRTQDVKVLLYDTIAQLAIDGPPPPVRARIAADGKPTVSRDIPPDCLDAELFRYVLAWLLKWAGITHHLWDAERLYGGFAAADGARRVYTVRFDVRNQHVSEGLYQRTVALDYVAQSTP